MMVETEMGEVEEPVEWLVQWRQRQWPIERVMTLMG